jgi:glycosyltransferase involved in cell wall biosynthesis
MAVTSKRRRWLGLASGCVREYGRVGSFTDSVEGFIVPVRDLNAISERLQILADDRQFRTRIGQAGLQRVRSIGGWEHYDERMYQSFSEVIDS